MATGNTNNFDYEKFAKEFARVNGGNSGPGSGAFDKLAAAASSATGALGGLAKTATEAAEGSLRVWRSLSGAGANFSNDIIGMSASAAKGRMSLDEFGEVIKDNAKNFTGLGGNVTRGAEMFSKFSEQMAKTGVTDRLRELGYTSKEANELLALQLSTTRSSQATDAIGKERAIKATLQLANEMDLTAKLTGKSRKEQEERMKALNLDAQVENKLRFETRGMRKEEAEAYKANVRRMLKEAQERGMGESAKERYATGTVTSEMGANQAALYNEDFSAMDKAFKALKAGQIELAKEYEATAKAANLRAQDNPAIQLVGSLGEAGGAAAAAVNKVTETNMELYHAAQSVKTEMGLLGTSTSTYRGVLDELIKRAEAPRSGIGPDGTRQDGALQGALAVGKALEDGRAMLATGLESAFKTAAQDGGKILANAITESINSLYGTLDKSVKALDQLNSGIPTTSKDLGVIGTGINAVKTVADGLVGLFKSGDAIVQAIPQRQMAVGGIVKEPTVALIGEGKVPEHVVPEDMMKSIIGNATMAGMKAFSGLLPSESSNNQPPVPQTFQPKLNLREFSESIKTTISSISSGGSSSTVDKAADLEIDSISKQFKDLAQAAKMDSEIEKISGQFKDLAKAADMDKELDGITAQFDELYKISDMDLEIDSITNQFKDLARAADMDKELDAVTQQFEELSKAADLDRELEAATKQFENLSKQSKNVAEAKPADRPKFLSADGRINLDMFSGSKIGEQLKVGGVSSIANNTQQQQTAANPAGVPVTEAQRAAAAAKPKNDKVPEVSAATANVAKATLDDVVTSLNMLNKQMGQLINQQNDLLTKQIRTTRDSSSSNIYDRMS